MPERTSGHSRKPLPTGTWRADGRIRLRLPGGIPGRDMPRMPSGRIPSARGSPCRRSDTGSPLWRADNSLTVGSAQPARISHWRPSVPPADTLRHAFHGLPSPSVAFPPWLPCSACRGMPATLSQGVRPSCRLLASATSYGSRRTIRDDLPYLLSEARGRG